MHAFRSIHNRLPPPLGRLLRKFKLLPAPNPQQVAPPEYIWLYDNIAFPTPGNPHSWSAEFVTAFLTATTTTKEISKVVADIAEKLGLAGNDEAEKRIASRVQPFLDVVLENRIVDLAFSGSPSSTLTLGPSNGMGVAVNELQIPPGKYTDGQIVESDAIGRVGGTMNTKFAGPKGWVVVSDIDDTIKVTKVRDRTELLKQTFALESQAVDGMPELYRELDRIYQPAWYYLSASPYSLFPTLRDFLKREQFPVGQMLLREMSWQELESFIVSLTIGTQEYKEAELERLTRYFPERQMICIGDSTQKDPESYATTYRNHPDLVKTIWIRVVKGVNESAEKSLNSTERFEKAFEGVPRHIWKLFDTPDDLNREATEFAKSMNLNF